MRFMSRLGISSWTVSCVAFVAVALTTVSVCLALPPTPPVPRGMKVPAHIDAVDPIPQPVKEVLDRDFRSRYPLASPFKIDVLKTTLLTYSAGLLDNGFGGYDTRHYFRVRAIHANGGKVLIETSLIERSNAEPDQDSILVESFRVINWAP